jgi:D-glycero-D-manno-heptose 1,7-bisphosphate phosphatase
VNRAVFLDRDGTINHAVVRDGKPYPPAALGELVVFDDATDALARLKRAGFLLVVVTNQPDVATGKTPRAVVEAINARLRDILPIDDVRVCWETDGPDCRCYKPKPGLLLDAARDHGIELGASWMVGDRWRDVGAGRAAGCRTVFIDRRYAEGCPETPDYTVAGLGTAADIILAD